MSVYGYPENYDFTYITLYEYEYVDGKLSKRKARYQKWLTGKLPDWDGAACASVDPEIFFVETHEVAKVAKAKLVCRSCPIREKCLDYALKYNMTFGVWGGTTVRERMMLRKLINGPQ